MARILIIEDEREMVELLEIRLQEAGHYTSAAYDGQAGLEKARLEVPDLIILDLMLPKMDGYRVCRMLKFDERFKAIPIIILTAKGQMKDLFELSSNIFAFVDKPFDPKHLVKIVRDALASPK